MFGYLSSEKAFRTISLHRPDRVVARSERDYSGKNANFVYLPSVRIMQNTTRRNYLFYGLMLLVFGASIWGIMVLGERFDGQFDPTPVSVSGVSHGWQADRPEAAETGELTPFDLFWQGMRTHLSHPLPLLLLQIISILIAVRIFSFLFKYLGQPGVIGEICAGIVLGPSVLGYFFPEVFAFLFSPDSLVPLNIISQIGLVLFMFIIGMELDLGTIRKKASETLVISHASIIVPFFGGVVLSYFVFPEFGATHTTFLPFALFVGISVSITAFPVLARIIQERNLSKTPMGMLAIASAANNDITAWCLLAAIIAIAKAGSIASAGFTLLAAVLYVLFMFLAVKPFMKKIGDIYHSQEVVNKTLVAFIFLVLILSSYITEILGIHALFGAFVAGVIMPDNINFRRVMTEKVEDVALVLFLPLFFVFTGLRTEIGLLNTPHLWGICGLFIVVSIAGKLCGAAFSARFVGESWKDSLSIGVLMNTRGLMELIVLNIGYEMGILPSSIYVIFVIMALCTTFMATPSLVLIEKWFDRGRRTRRQQAVRRVLLRPRILIAFARPSSAPVFLRIVHLLCGRYVSGAKTTVLHFTIGTETNPMYAGRFSRESFEPVEAESKRLGFPIETVYGVTDHYQKDLLEIVRREQYDFVLVGAGPNFISDYVVPGRSSLFLPAELHRINYRLRPNQWFFLGESARDKSKRLFNHIPATFGVFVDRGYQGARHIGVLLADQRDRQLLLYTSSVAGGAEVTVRVADSTFMPEVEAEMAAQPSPEREHCHLDPPGQPFMEFLQGKDLIIISYICWLSITQLQTSHIALLPSFLVIKPFSAEKNP